MKYTYIRNHDIRKIVNCAIHVPESSRIRKVKSRDIVDGPLNSRTARVRVSTLCVHVKPDIL